MHWARFVVLSTILGATHSITFNHGELPGMRLKNTKSWWRWSELSADGNCSTWDLKTACRGYGIRVEGKRSWQIYSAQILVSSLFVQTLWLFQSSSGWQMDVNAFWTEGRHTEVTYESWLGDKQKPTFREFLVCVHVCVHASVYVHVHRLNVPLVYIWFSTEKISRTSLAWLQWIIFGNEK